MSRLNEIGREFPDAVKVLGNAGFTSDSDIRSLDQTDLHELFPGDQDRKKRHDLYKRIHGKQSAGTTSRTRSEVLKKIKEVSPEAATVLQEKGCLDDLELLDRADLWELFPEVEKLKWRKKIFEIIHSQKSSESKMEFPNIFKGFNTKEGECLLSQVFPPQEERTSPPEEEREPLILPMRYQKLNSEKSQNVSNQVIKKVTNKIGVRFKETSSDHKVSILLCPVISRIGSDAEAAIASIKDDKPVILVFLIHSLKPQAISLVRPWDDSKNIVLHVNLFHHDTKPGLLRCAENRSAISAIEKQLLEYSEDISQDKDGVASGEGR